MSGIWLVIREAATSKKFIVTLAGVISGALLKIGLDLPTEDVAVILSPLVAYIVGQGFADRGKEAAKVTAVAEASRGMATPEEAIEAVKNT